MLRYVFGRGVSRGAAFAFGVASALNLYGMPGHHARHRRSLDETMGRDFRAVGRDFCVSIESVRNELGERQPDLPGLEA